MSNFDNEAVRVKVLAELEPLFIRADKEKLWFHSAYQDIWLSPKELRKHQASGSFIWGATNWTLRDPRGLLDGILAEIEAKRKRLEAIQSQLVEEEK